MSIQYLLTVQYIYFSTKFPLLMGMYNEGGEVRMKLGNGKERGSRRK